MLRLARQGLADVRAVAVGVRVLSLKEELRHAERTLRDIGLEVQVRRGRLDLADDVSSVLAAALREGTTNVLRHSDALSCEIGLGHCGDGALLRIVNDGVDQEQTHEPKKPADARPSGQGIRNLVDRAAALGGRVRAHTTDGLHTLEVHIPTANPC